MDVALNQAEIFLSCLEWVHLFATDLAGTSWQSKKASIGFWSRVDCLSVQILWGPNCLSDSKAKLRQCIENVLDFCGMDVASNRSLAINICFRRDQRSGFQAVFERIRCLLDVHACFKHDVYWVAAAWNPSVTNSTEDQVQSKKSRILLRQQARATTLETIGQNDRLQLCMCLGIYENIISIWYIKIYEHVEWFLHGAASSLAQIMNLYDLSCAVDMEDSENRTRSNASLNATSKPSPARNNISI